MRKFSDFQGDERDVVFLSLVDSGDGTGPLSMMGFGVDDAMRKRYNVAASRARDQLWVVHSLDAANDLKPGDMRKRLIDYAANPHALDVQHTEIEAHSESPFELAVATNLSDRGYHLVQQWKVGAYRLDMVALCGKKDGGYRMRWRTLAQRRRKSPGGYGTTDNSGKIGLALHSDSWQRVLSRSRGNDGTCCFRTYSFWY